jgi:hypothetical protein
LSSLMPGQFPDSFRLADPHLVRCSGAGRMVMLWHGDHPAVSSAATVSAWPGIGPCGFGRHDEDARSVPDPAQPLGVPPSQAPRAVSFVDPAEFITAGTVVAGLCPVPHSAQLSRTEQLQLPHSTIISHPNTPHHPEQVFDQTFFVDFATRPDTRPLYAQLLPGHPGRPHHPGALLMAAVGSDHGSEQRPRDNVARPWRRVLYDNCWVRLTQITAPAAADKTTRNRGPWRRR